MAIGQTIQKPAAMPVPAPDWDARPKQSVCIAADYAAVLELYRTTLLAGR
jgi:purine nucleosidase